MELIKNKCSLKYLLSRKVSDGPHETPNFIEKGIPFLSVDGIQNGELIFDGCRYISLEDHNKYKMKCPVEKGDILLGKAASVGKVARVKVDFPISVWSPLAILKPKRNILNPSFLEFSLLSNYLQEQIDILSTSNTQKNISMDDIQRLQVIYPSLQEQEQIVDFLDYKTAKIDDLLAKTTSKISLLKEKRTALINHSVTKGLNHNAPMKDSGVEWIGDIPTGWECVKLKYLCSVTTGGKDTQDKVDDGLYPFYVRSQKVERINSYSYEGESVLTAGDGVGVGKVFHYVNGKFEYHQRVYKFSDFRRVYGKFFFLFMKHHFIFVTKDQNSKSTVDSIRRPLIDSFRFSLPPLQEQQEIVAYLDVQTSKIDSTIRNEEKRIVLLKEYRQSLISNVVTGKIKVCN